MVMRRLDVVCGVIVDESAKILVSLRGPEQDNGGLWEFPGGKLEQDEQLRNGLIRELREELGIDVIEASPWLQVCHEYPMYHITLHVWNILKYMGDPRGQEGQIIRWVSAKDLSTLQFPEANMPVVRALLTN